MSLATTFNYPNECSKRTGSHNELTMRILVNENVQCQNMVLCLHIC